MDKELKHIKKHSAHKRVVFVSGNFNILHPGHLRLLRFAKECGDYLVVGVLDNQSAGAMIDEKFRLEGIQAIALVDHSFILREPLVPFLEKVNDVEWHVFSKNILPEFNHPNIKLLPIT